MCDLNKNSNLNQINHKNKSFNSFITKKIWLSRGQPIEVNTEIGVVEFVYFLNIGEIMKICLSLFV